MRLRNCIGSLLLTLMLCSCNSWLDVDLINQSEESDLFSTERGFSEALAGVYCDIAASNMYGQTLSFGMLDIMSRIYDYSQIPNKMKIFRDYDYENKDMKSYIYLLWSSFYANIAALNNILEWSEKNASVLSDERRNQVRGEALALRGLLHFDIYRLFATDVKLDPKARVLPYQTKFGVKTPPVYSTMDYLNLVIGDLEDAVKYLENDPIKEVKPYQLGNGDDENKDGADLYVARMNYYATKALLARVYLSMGGDKIKDARRLAEEVIDCGKFALVNYEKSLNTDEANKDLLFSDEHIFSLRGQNVKSDAEGVHKQITGTYGNVQMASGYQSILYLGDLEDYRLNWYKSFYIIKYTSDNSERFFPKMPMIRLSEMYLIAAEGWMEDDPEHAAELLQTLKQARTKSIVNKQTVTEEMILLEMRKEFVGEGQLFYVYKRLNHDIIGNTSEDGVKASNSVFVLPLPEEEIEYGYRN